MPAAREEGVAPALERALAGLLMGGSDRRAALTSHGGSGTGAGSAKLDGKAAPDGVLSVTPDSPCDSEWRNRRGPLDFDEVGGPWADEDDGGAKSTATRLRRRMLPPVLVGRKLAQCLLQAYATRCVDGGRPGADGPVWEVHLEDRKFQ